MKIHTVADPDEWNELVLGFPGADLRQSHEWGALRERLGWRPLRVAVRDQGRAVAAMAALARRVPGLGTVAYAPRGPLLDTGDEAAWAALPLLLDDVRQRTGAVFLRVSPAIPAGATPGLARLRAHGFRPLPELGTGWNVPRDVMMLSLAGSERELLAAMTPNRRQRVNSAERKGVRIEISSTREALRVFHGALVDHATRRSYPLRGWDFFEALYRKFVARNALVIVLAWAGGALAAAHLGVRFGPRAYALYTPATPAAAGTPASEALEWAWIRWAKRAGCTAVDFGGSFTGVPPSPAHPNYGIYRFKQEIGCRLVLCAPYHDRVFAPLRYRLLRHAEQSLAPWARRSLGRLQRGLRRRPPPAPRPAAAAA